MNSIMLDLETMGTGSKAAIVSIGAVRFDAKSITDQFYLIVDLQSSVDYGMEIDPDTINWWLKQSDEARGQFNSGLEVPLDEALGEFTQFVNQVDEDAEIWGNGASFDNVILSNAYKLTGRRQPWKFWNDRCYRTIKAMYPDIKMNRKGIYHNALDDAESQALHLLEILKRAT